MDAMRHIRGSCDLTFVGIDARLLPKLEAKAGFDVHIKSTLNMGSTQRLRLGDK